MARLTSHDAEPPGDPNDGFEDALEQPSKRQRLKLLGHSIKRAPKKTLNRLSKTEKPAEKQDGDDDDQEEEYDDDKLDADGMDIAGITDNPAFHTTKALREQDDDGPQGLRQQISNKSHAIMHPRQTAKKKAAQNFQPSQHPFLTPGADRELLRAHEELHDLTLKHSQRADPDASHESLDDMKAEVSRIETDRNAKRDAWITSRHVKRAKVVRTGLVDFPRGTDYRIVNEDNHFVRYDWARYLGHLMLWASDDFGAAYIDDSHDLMFKRGTLIHQLERVYIASLHWQTWLLHIKRVYMWDDKMLTLRWLFTYFVLLKTKFIATFFYLFVIFIVVRNRYFPTTATELRWSHERSLDEGKHVLNLSELMNRHGGENWLDPLLDELGPLLQQQMGDLADWLEINFNFYDWADARATTHSLIFWFCCALLSAFTSQSFGTSALFWVFGIYFFFSRPIASHYPQYRHLVSLLRWVHWDVPTHAELAFQNLQTSALRHQLKMKDQQSGDDSPAASHETPSGSRKGLRKPKRSNSASSLSSSDLSRVSLQQTAGSSGNHEHITISFKGRHMSQNGKLTISNSEIRFTPDRRKHGDTYFAKASSKILEIRKEMVLPQSKTEKARERLVPRPQESLHLLWIDGSENRIEEMIKRDECFNTIVGFSNSRWQSLQPAMDIENDVGPDHAESGGHKFFGKRKGAIDELSKF